MEKNIKNRKYSYTYVGYKDLGYLLLSFMCDLIVMLMPMAIWDAIMIGIFGSVFSISGLNVMNILTLILLVISTIVLNPLIYSYTRGRSLGMCLYGLQLMHKSGRRCNMHVIRLREFIGSGLPLCIALLCKQPLLLIGYYGINMVLCAMEPKHRTLIDFVLQTCIMKIDGEQVEQESQISRCDFHIHSSFSRGGEKSVEDIMVYAQTNKMEYISITDVNTVKHNPMAHTLAEKYGIHYVSGIEIKARIQEQVVSVLGYGIDYRDQSYVQLENVCLLAEKEASRLRIDSFSSVLGKKINTEELLNSQRFPKLNGETIAKYVLEHEDFKDCPLLAQYREMDSNLAYKKLAVKYFYITKDANGRYVTGSCYAEENYPSLSTVVQLIKETGGMCILADACSLFEDDNLLFYEVLKEDIDGFEVYRPDNLNKNVQKEVLKIAKDKNMVVICGSDYYSDGKARVIGDCGKMTQQEEQQVLSYFKVEEPKEETQEIS